MIRCLAATCFVLGWFCFVNNVHDDNDDGGGLGVAMYRDELKRICKTKEFRHVHARTVCVVVDLMSSSEGEMNLNYRTIRVTASCCVDRLY